MSRKSAEKTSDFGKRLKEIFNNISNQSIAEKLMVGNSALTAYMQGRVPPTDKLIEIRKLTGCNLDWLLTGEGDKYYKAQIKRPQGIILQGSKGGIGTSISAVFISAALALKGYGVLLADDFANTCSHLFYPNKEPLSSRIKTKKSYSLLPEKRSSSDYLLDYYLPTKNKNLDLFFPRHWIEHAPAQDRIKFFDFDHSEILKRYQFVIFDTQLGENPFYYSKNSHDILRDNDTYLENFKLEPILRNSKVIIPFDVLQSDVRNIASTLKYIEIHKMNYPDADLAGIFINHQRLIHPSRKSRYEEKLKELKKLFGEKIYQNIIKYHSILTRLDDGIEDIVFSRKTGLFDNYSALVDEIIEKQKF